MARILVIDDEMDMLALVKNALEKINHQVTTKSSLNEIQVRQINQFDLFILDVMMPDGNGFDFLNEHRHLIDIPVLFLTAKVSEQEMLEGFAFGADDYITKPFSLKELRARVEAHLRREQRERTQRLISGEISLDLLGKVVYVGQEVVEMTLSEYELTELLLKNKQQVFSKEDIYISLYGYEGVGDSATTITERVKKVRHKFARYDLNPIETVWGIGYKWQNNQSEGY